MQGPAPSAMPAQTEDEMLMRVLAQAAPQQGESLNPYAAGMQQQDGLAPNPFKGKLQPGAQNLIQQVLMEELNKPLPPPAAPVKPLPQDVKKPQMRR